MPAWELSMFSCSARHIGRVTVVAVAGEIDLVTIPELSACLAQLERAADLVVLDLRKVTFVSCAGIRVLELARDFLGLSGARVLARPSPIVTHMLRLVGVLDLFVPTVGGLAHVARQNAAQRDVRAP